MSTPINLVFKKGHDYLFAYCKHDGNSICDNLKRASYSDLEFIYNEINSRKNLENTYIDSIYGTIGDKDAETEGVVSFHTGKSIENAIVRFRADNGLIKKSIRDIVKYIENTQDIELFDCGWWTVWVDFDAEMVAGGDDVTKLPKFKPMKKKDFYTRSDSTLYDINRGSEYEDHFTKMGMRGVEMDNDSGYDGMEESMNISVAKQILKENGYQLVDEALEGPATSKQLWTLYKLTKKDYRGQDLSKEDAFKMIGDLLKNKDNGSKEKETVKKTPKTAKPKINDNPLVKVGEIYRFSFGYDMTINQYYKVLSTKGKRAQVVEIGKKWVKGDPGYTGEVVSDPDNEVDEPITALIKDDGTIRVKMFGRYHTAYRDNGSPSYENHMD